MTGVEPTFGTDNFGRANYTNEHETIANAILNLLFGRPGYFPSMPNLGINIQERIYNFWDDTSPELIKAEIIAQCGAFREFTNDGTLDVVKSSYKGQPLLLIVLPVIIRNSQEHLAIGITQDENGNTRYHYVFNEFEL